MFTSALKSFQSNISANYTIAPTSTSTSGAWKVYDGKKKSTGKLVSVFVFDRKSLDPQSGGLGGRSGGAALRKLHDEVISRVKKESNSLARLRHPSILELAEPIEDTRNGGLMFATEPVTASLAGLLQEKDDEERTGGLGSKPSRYVVEEADSQNRRRELEIDELEIQKGLLQIAQGLDFLHESAGLVHGNLTPEAIYINAKVCDCNSPSLLALCNDFLRVPMSFQLIVGLFRLPVFCYLVLSIVGIVQCTWHESEAIEESKQRTLGIEKTNK